MKSDIPADDSGITSMYGRPVPIPGAVNQMLVNHPTFQEPFSNNLGHTHQEKGKGLSV